MRHITILLLSLIVVTDLVTQQKSELPSSEKAQKTYKDALEHVKKHVIYAALDAFKKADKQDGGHCLACQRNVIKYALQLQDWKAATVAAEEMIAEAQTPREIALAHYQAGIVFMTEGVNRHKMSASLVSTTK